MHEVVSAAVIADDAARVAELALAEDGARDITSAVTIPADAHGVAQLEAREAMVLAGTAWADAVVAACGLPPVKWSARDGERVAADTIVGEARGDLRALLRAERPLLNIMQRACGVATMTRRYVDAVAGTSCRILHTRKTTPGLRLMEVAAVVAGGGELHRLDLAHAVMVKDNHWKGLAAAGRSLADALDAARSIGVNALYVEVESEAQLREACAAGATRLLIDNQSVETVAAWTTLARTLALGIEIEATGGITLETLRQYADAGVDYISTGALTHSVRAADLGLEVR